MKAAVQALIGLALAALLLYWVFRDKDPRLLRAAIARASVSGLLLGAALNFGHNHLRVLRWRKLLEPVRAAVPYRPMFAAVVLGYLTTWLVPGRIGELVRPALLTAKEGIPLGPSLGSVVSDRFLDGIAIVLLFLAGSLTATFAVGSAGIATQIRWASVLLALVMVAGLVVLAVLGRHAGRLEARLADAPGPVRWVGRAALALAQGADALRTPRLWLPILALSLGAWLMIALGTWIGIRATGITIEFSAALVLLPLLAIGVALPTPAGAGGYHAAMQFGLTQLFGVDGTAAAGAGLLLHLAVMLPVLVVGPVLLYLENLSLADLVRTARQIQGLGAKVSP
ncbi:MAG TPA: lysylphosphatidylglycerol synthase transmembrane domain-containing protein [Candidatus Polarisedimenticolaceae bacterium]|nr:lysylphosphatidylglycerol synthase transmembrane domain-containing protein [Candidatus Polarisedimenticolaceae bacterium]